MRPLIKQFIKCHAEFISASHDCRLVSSSKTDAYETLIRQRRRVQGDEVLKQLF
jgi:hypothetical protein